ncbi:MAG TPA: 2-amino-4-hydroxy-6-hydroxymethyldihydropteridine diphosphokinase [Acidimicrobiia bacterium]|nr:2-amino-4-hydroxy-6-hydroxymethyldihydropteridine diphosphokinase [Acidimicrobiia bacterium]
MPKVAISLGSNLGDRLANLRFAIERLSRSFSLTSLSSLYLTAPVGGPAQDDFLNAVALIDSDQPPLEILGQLQGIEAAAGRVRNERFGPRTLDLDLIAIEGISWASADLELPHPRSHQRRFVVEPLNEVWPEASLSGGPAASLLRTVGGQQVVRLADSWLTDPLRFVEKGTPWLVVQFGLLIATAVVVLVTGNWPPAGWSWLGLIPMGAGLFFIGSGAKELGPAFTASPTPRQAQLTDSGVYQIVRHPIYMGLLLGAMGAVILWRAWWGLMPIAVLAGFLRLKARFEEQRLRVIYPAYADYAGRVRATILPGWR